jgi:hypothetical protein
LTEAVVLPVTQGPDRFLESQTLLPRVRGRTPDPVTQETMPGGEFSE